MLREEPEGLSSFLWQRPPCWVQTLVHVCIHTKGLSSMYLLPACPLGSSLKELGSGGHSADKTRKGFLRLPCTRQLFVEIVFVSGSDLEQGRVRGYYRSRVRMIKALLTDSPSALIPLALFLPLTVLNTCYQQWCLAVCHLATQFKAQPAGLKNLPLCP